MKNMGMVAKICILTSEQRHTLWYLIIFLHNKWILVCAFNVTVWSELLYSDLWCCTWVLGVLNEDKFGSPILVFILFVLEYRIEYVLLPSQPVQWYNLHTQVCLWVCTQTYLGHFWAKLVHFILSIPKYAIDMLSCITEHYYHTLYTWVQDLSI